MENHLQVWALKAESHYFLFACIFPIRFASHCKMIGTYVEVLAAVICINKVRVSGDEVR